MWAYIGHICVASCLPNDFLFWIKHVYSNDGVHHQNLLSRTPLTTWHNLQVSYFSSTSKHYVLYILSIYFLCHCDRLIISLVLGMMTIQYELPFAANYDTFSFNSYYAIWTCFHTRSRWILHPQPKMKEWEHK